MEPSSSMLAVCTLAVLCVLAGCSGNSGTPSVSTPQLNDSVTPETREPTATATPFEPSVADTNPERTFLEQFRGRNLAIRSVETRNGTFSVRYDAVNGSDQQTQAAFFLALAYGSAVNGTWATNTTWNASQMDALALDDRGETSNRFRVPAYWGRQTAMGELDTTEFAARIRNASENLSREAPTQTSTLRSFREGADAETAATVTASGQVGNTVFLTIESETDDTTLEQTLTDITDRYGTATLDAWNTTAVEVTIRDPNGDLYGWYRVESAVAADVANGTGSVPGGVLGTVYRENDALESNRSSAHD